MNIKVKSLKEALSKAFLEISVLIIVMLGADCIGVISEDWFLVCIGIWFLIQGVRILIYIIQCFSNQTHSLILSNDHIIYKKRHYDTRNAQVRLIKSRFAAYYYISIVHADEREDIIQLGSISHLHRGDVIQCFEQFVEDHNAVIETQTDAIDSGIRWGHETLEGNIEGFELYGVVYNEDSNKTTTILQTHTDKAVPPQLLEEILLPNGVLDIRTEGDALDFLIDTDYCDHEAINAYLELVFKNLKAHGICPISTPSTLPLNNTMPCAQKVFYVFIIIVVITSVYITLNHITFLTQLGQALKTHEEIHIRNYTFLIPFVSPILLILIMNWLDIKMRITQNIRKHEVRYILKLSSFLWVFCLMALVNFVFFIEQGNALFKTNVPVNLEGYGIIKTTLQHYDFMKVYIYGYRLSIASWMVLFVSFLVSSYNESANRHST